MSQTSPSSQKTRHSFFRSKSNRNNKNAGPSSSRPRKDSEPKMLTTKADPNAAINESQPIAAQLEASTLGSLRSMTYSDRNGNQITEPDLSNPTRYRWERPLDTIRGFQENIDRAWYEKRGLNSSGSQTGFPGSSSSIRNSHYQNGSQNQLNGAEYNRRSGGAYSPRGFAGPAVYSPPYDQQHPDMRAAAYVGPEEDRQHAQMYQSRPGQRPGYPPMPEGAEPAGERVGSPYQQNQHLYANDRPENQSDDPAGGRDLSFQNKFGAILAYADSGAADQGGPAVREPPQAVIGSGYPSRDRHGPGSPSHPGPRDGYGGNMGGYGPGAGADVDHHPSYSPHAGASLGPVPLNMAGYHSSVTGNGQIGSSDGMAAGKDSVGQAPPARAYKLVSS